MGFWQGKRVLVTGGQGFLGTHLVTLLEREGAEVTTTRSLHHDLTREEAMCAAFRESRAEYVFHAAADVGGIGYNRLSPADIFRNNTRMAVNVLEASRRFPVRKVVMIGSACAYPGEVDGLMSEADFLAGPMHESVEVYGFSKRALYLGGKAYRSQYGVNAIFLLLTNLYGPHDKYDEKESHVVAALVSKFVEAKREGAPEVVCWGTGRPVREFMYAEDCARAILRAGEVYDESDPLNIGTGVGTTIRELAEALKEATGYAGRIVWDDSKPDGAMRKVLDVTRMREALDPPPPTPLREGLAKTVAWYEANCPAAAPASVG
jgi:nucleoside-diphosphate-sugar epimerase